MDFYYYFQEVDDPLRSDAPRSATMADGCLNGTIGPACGPSARSPPSACSPTARSAPTPATYLLGAKLTAERFAHVARIHWAIGNSLHWVLDVTMGEDAARRGSGAACPAIIRRLALDVARAHPANISMRRKFRRAGISFDFLLGMLRAVQRRE